MNEIPPYHEANHDGSNVKLDGSGIKYAGSHVQHGGHNVRYEEPVLHFEVEGENSGDESGRQTWSSQVDFVMTCVGCAVGLGNIWRFPYLCYRNGGGAFLVPYLISFFCAAAPVFVLEISLGQYTKSGCVRAWDVVPAFRGLGFASFMVMLYSNIYYIVVISWSIYYIAASFTSQLPWSICGQPWNTDRCFVTGMSFNTTLYNAINCTTNCSSEDTTPIKRVDAVVEYWENAVLRKSDGIDTVGEIVPGLAVSLLVAWFLVFICLCRGIKLTGKIVYFTALCPYVLLTVILIRGVTLEGSIDGIIFYLRPDFTRLADVQVWIDGGTQVLYSIGIAQGFMIALGSYNKFHNNCVRNSLIIITINCLTSIFGGLSVFAVLGFMAHELGESVHNVVDSGPGLVFLAYPKAVTQMPLSPLWSCVFFLSIFFVGLDSQFAAVEGFLTPIIDAFPDYLYRTRNRTILVAVYCCFCYLMALPMVTQGGVYVFRLIDYYCASGLVLLMTCTFEAVAIGWVFGADRFYDVLEIMTGQRYNAWIKVCWKYLAPLIAQGIFWFELCTYKPLRFDSTYEYPDWATALGFCLTLSSTLCIPVTLVVYMCTASGSLKQMEDGYNSGIKEAPDTPVMVSTRSLMEASAKQKLNIPRITSFGLIQFGMCYREQHSWW